jgi:hypothetical protein
MKGGRKIQMNLDEILVEDVISQFALRQLHVIRQGRPVDPHPWVERVPDDASDLVKLYQVHEKELDMYHLYVVWNARELVDLSLIKAPLRYAVVWFVADGETASWTIEVAACAYERIFKRWPKVAWLQKVLSHYPKELRLDCGEVIRVEQADWVPQERYVCVGIPKSEFDPTIEVDMSYREVGHG